jgi:NADH-quinone oxidoreductase B subunit
LNQDFDPIERRFSAMGALADLVTWARLKSPWIVHFNSGACNACDIEVVAALTPRFDIERLGILQKGSPRHGDILVCTGPVTKQAGERLKRIYEQMPDPKFVIAVGTCACSGGVFSGCYSMLGGVDQIIPVDVYIPGCSTRPDAIIDGVVKLITKIKTGKPVGYGIDPSTASNPEGGPEREQPSA